MADSDSAYSAELLRAYTQFKLERQKLRHAASSGQPKEPQSRRPLRPRNDGEFSIPSTFSELRPALDIRKSRSGERRSGSSASNSVDSRSVSPLRPVNGTSVPVKTLSQQVHELTQRVISTAVDNHHPRTNGPVPAKKNIPKGFRISRAGRRIHSSLPDVAEEDEPASARSRKSLVNSARLSRSEENLKELADHVRNQLTHVDTGHVRRNEPAPSRPQGSAKMVDSLLRMQQQNESLLAHLKQMMSAYTSMKTALESSQKSLSENLAKSDKVAQEKNSDILRLQQDLEEYKKSAEAYENEKQEEGIRTQMIEVKLAQAVSRISKLQRENEDLKSASSARSEHQQLSEKSMMRRIMDLERDLAKAREKEEEWGKMHENLSNKDLEIQTLREKLENSSASGNSGKQKKLSELQSRVDILSDNVSILEKQIATKDGAIHNLKIDLLDKDKETQALKKRNLDLQKELDAKSDSARFREKFSSFQKELQSSLEKNAALENERDGYASEARRIRQELEEKNWRIEKLQKDLEKLSKEKDRAYEKIHEAREEDSQLRMKDQKDFDDKLRGLKDELEEYRERCKDAEKQVAKLRVGKEEQSARYREQKREWEIKLRDLEVANKQYRQQLEEITVELMALDAPALNDA